MKNNKRSSYLSARYIHLGKRPIKIWGYNQAEKFVCRLEINAAGLEVFSGVTGGKRLRNWNWESLVKELKQPRKPN
jgi:hypothetical protein